MKKKKSLPGIVDNHRGKKNNKEKEMQIGLMKVPKAIIVYVCYLSTSLNCPGEEIGQFFFYSFIHFLQSVHSQSQTDISFSSLS